MPGRVHRGDAEADDHERRDPHVEELQPDRAVEHRRPRIDVGDLAVDDAKSGRRVHPRVHREDAERAGNTRQRDRDQNGAMLLGWHAFPAVEVDAEEDRLEEERDALQRERQPDHVAELAHELRPQQAHLEAEDRARHRADGEQHRRDLRPSLGETERDRRRRRESPRPWITQIIAGNATPKHDNTMCVPSETVICQRAGSSTDESAASR